MAGLGFEHSIELLDRLAELLPSIELVRHQEMIEDTLERSRLGRLLVAGRVRRVTEQVQIACPPQVKSAERRSQPPRLIEVAQSSTQVLFLFERLPLGRGLGLRLGKNQEKLRAIRQDLGLLRIAQVGVELGSSLLSGHNTINGQRLPGRCARLEGWPPGPCPCTECRGTVPRRANPANDCNRTRDAFRSASTRNSCSTCASSATAGSFSIPRRVSLPIVVSVFSRSTRAPRPITGGHPDAGAVEKLLPLLLQER